VKWGIVFTIAIVFGLGLSLNVSAEEGLIPAWIKSTASFWVDGNIGDSEFISALQFLINQNIIEVPITQVDAAKVNLSDGERAQSFVVHMTAPEFGGTQSFYSFSIFSHTSKSIPKEDPLQSTGLSLLEKPQFYLISLPSEDKSSLYSFIGQILERGQNPDAFPVNVDVLSGAGNIIQTWSYRDCYPIEHLMYVEENEDIYRLSDTDDSEIREKITFECIGYNLKN